MSTDEGVRQGVASDPEPPAAGGTGVDVDAPTSRRAGRRRKTETEIATETASSPADADPRFWHRAHPVFTPLAGFFTGVVTIIVVLAALGWLLEEVFDYGVSDHPWVFLAAVGAVFLVNLVLVALPGTRRFARYMLFGVLATPAVIAGVAALTTYLLIRGDG